MIGSEEVVSEKSTTTFWCAGLEQAKPKRMLNKSSSLFVSTLVVVFMIKNVDDVKSIPTKLMKDVSRLDNVLLNSKQCLAKKAEYKFKLFLSIISFFSS